MSLFNLASAQKTIEAALAVIVEGKFGCIRDGWLTT